MNLLLDVISPIPEFTVIDDNKIILSRSIIQFEGDKLSDSIIPTFLDIEKSLNLGKYMSSLIVTTGPASYTSLRVGIAFILGQHFAKNIKIATLTAENLLKLNIYTNKALKHGIYIISANNQRFICYQLENLKYSIWVIPYSKLLWLRIIILISKYNLNNLLKTNYCSLK